MIHNELPRVEDVASVGTRISWGAILAGAMIALGMYFLLTSLAAAVGWSISDRMQVADLQTSAIVWAFLTTVAAFLVGGVVTSLLTAGEDKIEAILYGVIMWALLIASFTVLATIGVRSGFTSMAAMAAIQREPIPEWEAGARQAGVPATVIADWLRKSESPEAQASRRESATRVTWCVFAGTWISMFAAAAGALLGAGPTFRIVRVTPAQRVLAA